MPEGGSGTLTIQTDATVPWQPAAEVSEAVGMSIALFGYPGSGKTTFSAVRDSLILDLEGGTEVLADRADVMVWPRKDPRTGKRKEPTWPEVSSISSQLLTKKHPFRVVTFDTMTKLQSIALKSVSPGLAQGQQPSQPEYGKANNFVNDLIEKWCAHARENNIAVVFNVHAAEVKDEDSGSLLIRMDLTPGVIKVMYREVSHIAYIEEYKGTAGKTIRRLQLANTAKVTAKFRQPQSGPQVPSVVDGDKVSLDYLLKHREDARQARLQLKDR
jgi:AAA domain